MSTDVIFYTQIATIVAFIAALFIPYRILVAQKDAVIELLKLEVETLKRKLGDAQSQSPDVLVAALSSRVDIAKMEISRLREDGNVHQEEIREKESQLLRIQGQLTALNQLIEGSDLVCPKCNAPLVTRGSHTIYSYSNEREYDADIEYLIYECGYSTDGGEEKTPCQHTVGRQ